MNNHIGSYCYSELCLNLCFMFLPRCRCLVSRLSLELGYLGTGYPYLCPSVVKWLHRYTHLFITAPKYLVITQIGYGCNLICLIGRKARNIMRFVLAPGVHQCAPLALNVPYLILICSSSIMALCTDKQ